MPRSACRAWITSCIRAGASLTASSMACSRRRTRAATCSTSCQVIQQRVLLRRLLKMHLLFDPVQVLLGPHLDSRRGSAAVTQQKLAESVPCPQLILFGRFPGPHQVPQALHVPRPAPRLGSDPRPDNCAPACWRPVRSVFTRSPALTGTKLGATTSHFTPSAVSCQYSTYPVGPAS